VKNKNQCLEILHPILNEISPLSKGSWQEAETYFTVQHLSKGEYLFRSDDKVTDFYFLIDGLARYYYISDEGKEFNKSFAEKPGHLLSSISSVSMPKETSPFDVQTLSAFTALVISYEDILALTHGNTQWHNLLLRIYERLVVKKERREADFLLLDATSRYEKFLEEYAMISHVVPNYHIASYLGITEVALSRIRKAMNLT
jgi:CRP-like cAMP-binding protein